MSTLSECYQLLSCNETDSIKVIADSYSNICRTIVTDDTNGEVTSEEAALTFQKYNEAYRTILASRNIPYDDVQKVCDRSYMNVDDIKEVVVSYYVNRSEKMFTPDEFVLYADIKKHNGTSTSIRAKVSYVTESQMDDLGKYVNDDITAYLRYCKEFSDGLVDMEEFKSRYVETIKAFLTE